jgi:hypothetical protein
VAANARSMNSMIKGFGSYDDFLPLNQKKSKR